MQVCKNNQISPKQSHKIKCELCNKAVADKTNSHIIPSFIVCHTASADGSGKRNHELIYSIGKVVHAYIGNEVSQDALDRNFDDLTDERIEEELSKNVCSKDYVFCSSCETALGNYLESPYAANKKRDTQMSYFFWMSIVWRLNHFGYIAPNSSCMPKFISTELRKSLNDYLQAKKNGANTSCIKQKYPFYYSILRCDGYSKEGGGAIYAEYNKAERILSVALGDIIACFLFKGDALPDVYRFLGVENELKKAPLNNGNRLEVVSNVSSDVFDRAYRILIEKTKPIYINNEINTIHWLWHNLGKTHDMPSPHPSEYFMRRCIEIIHDSRKKPGERHTYRNFAISFANALTEIYGIQFEKES